jgi:hypothetical protein
MNINFNSNEDHNKLLVSNLHKRFAQVKQGGGQTRIDKLHTNFENEQIKFNQYI